MKFGHNERSYRLDVLAEEARKGLQSVEQGEEATIGGWLAYGHALNEGRALFPGDKEFGEWTNANALRQVVGADGTKRDVFDAEREAAMWAAANADQFEEARQRGNPRTIRGIHAKWKEIEREREQAEWEEQQRKAAEERKSATETPPAEQAAPEGGAPSAKVEAATDAVEDVASGGGGDSAAPAFEPELGETSTWAEPEPDPYGYARLTEEALLDTANGLRADLEDERARRKAAEAERDRLASEIKTTLAGSDLGPAVSKLRDQVARMRGKRDDLQAANARQQRRINRQNAEIKELRKKLEKQEIWLC